MNLAISLPARLAGVWRGQGHPRIDGRAIMRIISAGWQAVARGLAFFLGGFTLLNLLGELRVRGFDANIWWIDLQFLPLWLVRLALAVMAGCLLAYAVRPQMAEWRLHFTLRCLAVLLTLAVMNLVQFYSLVEKGVITAGMPVPLSLFVCLALGVIAIGLFLPAASTLGTRGVLLATVGVCLVGFPVLQMYCFGKTDYRRPADAIVVFGARAYASGHPSLVLHDRVCTGVELYRQGYAPLLVFSGGPGDGAVHETESMRRLAVSLGVPDSAILRDTRGYDTEATVANTAPLFRRHGVRHVLAVSTFYHLPRIKMAYQRAGWSVVTVPAQQTRPISKLRWLMAREIAALWVYYLRPLGRG